MTQRTKIETHSRRLRLIPFVEDACPPILFDARKLVEDIQRIIEQINPSPREGRVGITFNLREREVEVLWDTERPWTAEEIAAERDMLVRAITSIQSELDALEPNP